VTFVSENIKILSQLEIQLMIQVLTIECALTPSKS